MTPEGPARVDGRAGEGSAAAQMRQSPAGGPATSAPASPTPAAAAPTSPEYDQGPAAANDAVLGSLAGADPAPPGPQAGRAGGAGPAAHPPKSPDPGPPEPPLILSIPRHLAMPGYLPDVKQEEEGSEEDGEDRQEDGEDREEDGAAGAAEEEPTPETRWLGCALKNDLRNLQGELESRVAALEGRFAAWSGPGVPERKDPTTLGPDAKEALRQYFALQSSLKLNEAPDIASYLGENENEVRTYFSRLHNQLRRVFEKIERKNQELAGPPGERKFNRMKSELAEQRKDWGDVLMACRDLGNAGTATIFVAFMRRTHSPIVMQSVLGSLLAEPDFLIIRRAVLVQAGFLEALRDWASPARVADRQSALLSGVLRVLSALQLDTAPPNERRGLKDILSLLHDLAGYHRPPIAAGAQRLLEALGPAAPG